MERIIQDKELRIMCVTAASFPEGIMDAFRELEKKGGDVISNRPFFGLSKPNEKGVIIYHAGVLEMNEGEASRFGFDLFVLPEGQYLSKTITDWMKNVPLIGETFREMTHHPDLDPSSYCIEMYKGENDVVCMVKVKEGK